MMKNLDTFENVQKCHYLWFLTVLKVIDSSEVDSEREIIKDIVDTCIGGVTCIILQKVPPEFVL